MRIHQSFLDRLKAAATQEQVDAAWARFCAEATSFARTEFARSKSIWMKYYPEAAAAIEATGPFPGTCWTPHTTLRPTAIMRPRSDTKHAG